MTLLLKEISTLAACVFVVLSYSSSAFAKLLLTGGKHEIIQVEGEPHQFECVVTGTEDELDGKQITWQVPDLKKRTHTSFKPGDGNITTSRTPGKLTSILYVPKPPTLSYEPTVLLYKCGVPGTSLQTSFPFVLVKENAVPKIDPIKEKLRKKGEKILLRCFVSYYNKNPNNKEKFSINLAWIKDGKYLQNVSYPYKFGINATEYIIEEVTIENFKNGGNYVCRWMLKYSSTFITNNYTLELQISPYLDGPAEKEVKDTAGSDVELICDVNGYPITFDWQYENGNKIVGDNRIKLKDNILTIDDITYDDRKKYLCFGNVTATNTTAHDPIKQTIILRVKDPLAALWPFIGILIEAIIIAAIIFITEHYRSRNDNEKDSAGPKTETTEQPSTSQT